MNFLQKIRFKPTEHWDLQYSFTYAETGNAPRYDRLIQYRNGAFRFAEWNYGPMLWKCTTCRYCIQKRTSIYDDARFTVAYQNYEESRIDRTRANNNRNRQIEQVDAISANWDATKRIGKDRRQEGHYFMVLNMCTTKWVHLAKEQISVPILLPRW